LAIGRRGQNVRLASKLSGWDIEIMTQDELAQAIDRAVTGFSSLTGVEVELAERLVEEGFLSYDDLSIIEPDALMAMGNLSEETASVIVEQAEERAEQAEAQAAEARRQKREQERLAEMAAEAGMKLAPMDDEAVDDETADEETGRETAEEEPEQFGEEDVSEEALDENGSADESDANEPSEDSTHERSESAT
jgi:N utilization substance protein A